MDGSDCSDGADRQGLVLARMARTGGAADSPRHKPRVIAGPAENDPCSGPVRRGADLLEESHQRTSLLANTGALPPSVRGGVGISVA